MKFVHLPRFWDTDQADTVIRFLDDLREALGEAYGEQITELEHQNLMGEQDQARQDELDFGEDIDF